MKKSSRQEQPFYCGTRKKMCENWISSLSVGMSLDVYRHLSTLYAYGFFLLRYFAKNTTFFLASGNSITVQRIKKNESL